MPISQINARNCTLKHCLKDSIEQDEQTKDQPIIRSCSTAKSQASNVPARCFHDPLAKVCERRSTRVPIPQVEQCDLSFRRKHMTEHMCKVARQHWVLKRQSFTGVYMT